MAPPPSSPPTLTRRASLLTDGLESLRKQSPAIKQMLVELYKLDDELQEMHARAKEDDEFGEDVVVKYEEFLAHREAMISALERASIPVPWQLYVKIDDLELTRRQRQEKKEGASAPKGKTKRPSVSPSAAGEDATQTAQGVAEPRGASLALFVAPALLALLVAALWAHWQS